MLRLDNKQQQLDQRTKINPWPLTLKILIPYKISIHRDLAQSIKHY
jgi:hypothetical protein